MCVAVKIRIFLVNSFIKDLYYRVCNIFKQIVVEIEYVHIKHILTYFDETAQLCFVLFVFGEH